MIKQQNGQKRYKSVTIPSTLVRSFRKWVMRFPNQREAAIAAGFKHENSIRNFLTRRTCSSESLEKIEAAVKNK